MSRTFFITGTDTGVGKTVLTALLLHHLRRTGVHAVAVKPFCCGDRGDVELFQVLQGREFPSQEVNPFYYDEPLAPLLAARMHQGAVKLAEVLTRLRRLERKCEFLLVEGIGGLFVPLGENFMVRDLIVKFGPEVILVGRARIGTINHTLLSALSLRDVNIQRLKIVLMGSGKDDFSCARNPGFLREILDPTPVWTIPFLGKNASAPASVKKNCKKIEKVLAEILQ